MITRYKERIFLQVRRIRGIIMLIKLALGEETINIISAYNPQIKLEESIKHKFWEDMDELIQELLNEENIFIGGYLNVHDGKR